MTTTKNLDTSKAGTKRLGTKAAGFLAAVVLATSFGLAGPADASTAPAATRGQVFCSTSTATVHPAAAVNQSGAPGWVYSYFYVHDSKTQRWTISNMVATWGGAGVEGRQPSYYWTGQAWQQIDHRGIQYRASASSTQTMVELRYTYSAVMAQASPWTYEWVQGGSCSTNVQRPW